MKSHAVFVRITSALHTSTGAEITMETMVSIQRKRRYYQLSLINPYKLYNGRTKIKLRSSFKFASGYLRFLILIMKM